MSSVRPFKHAIDTLRKAGLRPTRQRMGLARLLFENGDRHTTAEQLHAEAAKAKLRVSLATIYNALHNFTEAGLLREVVVESGRSYFDTNISDHHHFFNVDRCELRDIPGAAVSVDRLPKAPGGAVVERVDVIVRIRDRRSGALPPPAKKLH